ncbi:MAG: peptide chain release factor N(5)-glutamine methyltransferase [Clostridia bacterium]|nr:peptide chain release factor N(5)-glutamine methyltransferase [Clostridia bacterium]
MKISDILKNTAERLKKADIDTANLDAKLLLCKYLNKDKLYLIVNANEEVEVDSSFSELVERRENYEPMQYILGKAEFYGLDFKVNKNVLIPRPDTEILVERVIDFVGDNQYTVLDIGTGSGCIPITVAVNCKNAKAYTVDISPDATEVAVDNAKNNGVGDRVTFLNMDILKDFPDFKVDCIVSNPPYIEDDVIPTLMEDVKNYEPIIALSGGEDGLIFYRRIAEKGKDILNDGGFIAFEVGHNQAQEVKEILDSNGYSNIEITKDLAGIDRVVTAVK